jgi:hypothetical protein
LKTPRELALEQIDRALELYASFLPKAKYQDLSDLKDGVYEEVRTIMASTLLRLAPGNSPYLRDVDKSTKYMVGALRALRRDYADGVLATFDGLVRADVFSDVLEMAQHLMDEGYKDPAAVLIGSVLEEHLRALCVKNGLDIVRNDHPLKADALNAALAKASSYNKLDQKNVTAWLDLRNKAAHGQFDQYTKEQVLIQLAGVREFLGRLAP